MSVEAVVRAEVVEVAAEAVAVEVVVLLLLLLVEEAEPAGATLRHRRGLQASQESACLRHANDHSTPPSPWRPQSRASTQLHPGLHSEHTAEHSEHTAEH